MNSHTLLTRDINRAMKITWNCASEFMNGYVIIRFIVAQCDSAKDENRKDGGARGGATLRRANDKD